ncbi:MAG TPA: cell division protein SepF [Pseudonocardiaceae bacterium]|nr:cell division protein SepF [Pseudonocardiaceae bacterium]
MSMLQRLKAYFGMVPAEELDDYDPDYEAGHRAGYDGSGYDGSEYYGSEYYGSNYEPGHGAGHDGEAIDDARGRFYASERAATRRPRRGVREDGDGRARYGRADDGYIEPEVASIRSAHRPGWPADAAPVCGALAVDTATALRDHVREPAREPVRGHVPCIITLHPRTYNEARIIGERYREGTPVIMNLTEMDDADAKRLVDFAAGLAFALRGAIDKVTTKVFLLSPTDVAVSAAGQRRLAEDDVSPRS